ncbi:hypothetical protein PHYBLDRAFT_172369 [Phycomyces blakesleeanus NRRL 1555(-)]|uniref:Uncharacterized protein n=1 Tax=Phycomyces blakesleeanus (strain ATCC 8743b / DSM 1359 / FGSC 10004 / NBRC 33097 / NRRL 1555) TaxID=763407 RepID=A0A167KXH3_PHYB8|nr:hypothetical protein PHYBLDRAFT_172369 [Phycomyces blakesleeanus NRRL 1555(-)]OAD69116.1 hypothetical protein PHYBLDRAFT_172369 [Phycomyces blakesleeanus NRRL 1555(-)]|eukprot:XP_018287156.1 hypothetical protein PHYBLDRAFT_172369 [Phycomyces blakesleeanus NRRL 1555(-)]
MICTSTYFHCKIMDGRLAWKTISYCIILLSIIVVTMSFFSGFKVLEQRSTCCVHFNSLSCHTYKSMINLTGILIKIITPKMILLKNNKDRDTSSIRFAEATTCSIPFFREDKAFKFEEEYDTETSSSSFDNNYPDQSEEFNDENEAVIVGGIGFKDKMASGLYLKMHGMSQGEYTTLKLICYFLVTNEKDTQPHVTVDVLKTMSGFGLRTETISKYTVCSNFSYILAMSSSIQLFLQEVPSELFIYSSNSLYVDSSVDNVLPMVFLFHPGYAVLSAKIESGLPYMKADEWRSWRSWQSWCLIYSLVILKDALPENDYKNWTLFVKACQKSTGPSVTYSEIDSTHQLLGEFGKKCEILYGESSITPNMHLHMQLHESMLDFGPVYAFWLYSFERYNGKLKNIKTNRRNCPEVTLMRVFLEKSFIDVSSPLNLDVGHPPALPFSLAIFQQAITNPWYNWLFEFYVKAYQSTSVSFCAVGRIPICEDVFVNNRIRKMKKISLLGQEYFSGEKKKRGSYVRVVFRERASDVISKFPGQIEYILTRVIKIGGTKRVPTFAFVKWFSAYHSSSHQPLADQGLQS